MPPALALLGSSIFVAAYRYVVIVQIGVIMRTKSRKTLVALRPKYTAIDCVLIIVSIASLTSVMSGFWRTVSSIIFAFSLLTYTAYIMFNLAGTAGQEEN